MTENLQALFDFADAGELWLIMAALIALNVMLIAWLHKSP